MKEIILKGLDEKIYEHVTKEGLKVYVWQNERLNGTYMALAVPYGSIHTNFKVDNKSYKVPNGIAHFLEHIKFNLNKDDTAHERYSKIGGEGNAFTTFELTSYNVYASQNIIENLKTLIDLVFTSYFTKPIIAKEKGIITEETRTSLDSPQNTIYFELFRQLFHKYKYRNLVTGEVEDINKITLDDVLNVYNAFYHPENCYLVVTGNANPYDIAKTVDEALSEKEFPKFIKPKINKVKEDKSVVKKFSELELEVTSDELRYAIKIPRSKFKNFSERDLINYLYILEEINFGATSDFRQNLREKELVSSFDSDFYVIDDYVILLFMAVTDYSKEVEKALDNQINNLDCSKEIFNRKKKVEIANLILQFEDNVSFNERLQFDLIRYGKIIDDMKESLENMDINHLKEISSIINNDNKTVIYVKAKKDNDNLNN